MFRRILIANRGEIACRLIRAASELDIETVALFSADDAGSRHITLADRAFEVPGAGSSTFLDPQAIVALALEHECDALHPGYGFLSENESLAIACAEAGVVFIGPSPDALARFGNKESARSLAAELGIATLQGSGLLENRDAARAWVDAHGPTMLKAVAGGGGRGMRPVTAVDDVEAAFDRAASEASGAFGDGALYAEALVVDARHIEVQILGDESGQVVVLGDRDCSVQRQNQKIIEIAPADLSDELRDTVSAAARALAEAVGYVGLGTFEFLVDRSNDAAFFIEANARLQVEHTVTEEVTGLDLVQLQIQVADGETLDSLGVAETPPVVGHAIQLRINTETIDETGVARPTGGTLSRFDPPSGMGVRVETHAHSSYTTSPSYDSLLAKVIVHSRSGGFPGAVRKASRALGELEIAGVATNAPFLAAILTTDEFGAGPVATRFVQDNAVALVAASAGFEPASQTAQGADSTSGDERESRAGVVVDSSDPLAVLALGKQVSETAGVSASESWLATAGSLVSAPMQGTIVTIEVEPGQEVVEGAALIVMEAMKMEHVITATESGLITALHVAQGEAVFDDAPLVSIEPRMVDGGGETAVAEVDLDVIRPDLAEVNTRHGFGLDKNRPEAVAKRHAKGKRTARENLADLVDGDSFVEWGGLAVAAQRKRRSIEDLIERTPGDGLVGGIGTVNGELFTPQERASDHDVQAVVVSYDYMVLAGTQGLQNHRKKDRLFELAHELRLPVVLFAEGGGGRPGDTDGIGVAGLDCLAFALFGELSGLVPLIGINAGYCFAGNAALLGCCDVVIATADSNLGMGGPAMIEGGGLGVFHPSEVGPASVQSENGVIDVVVADEAEAVAVAKQYLSYFQGPLSDWEAADQRRLRHVIPENRLRIYDVREVIDTMFDADSVLELRREFGLGMITAFARIEGRPVGVVANNPTHLAGAIDADAADKASRFMQLCDAFDIPIVFLCDTPGIMVGPEAEKSALVRHASRMFVTGAGLDVPVCTIVLRKGYGLGAQAMAAGGFKSNLFTVSWPTGEFGGMGLEGAVKLGYRNELAAIDDPAERLATFETMVDRMYEVGKGVSMADHFEIDDVIDPVESRRWIATAFASAPPKPPRTGKKRPNVDTW